MRTFFVLRELLKTEIVFHEYILLKDFVIFRTSLTDLNSVLDELEMLKVIYYVY